MCGRFPKKRILFIIRIRPILISEYYSLFVFVPFSLFVATLLTTYKATFYCNTCQTQYRGLTEWDNPSFEAIPEIGVQNQQNAINPAHLMTTLMNETFPVNCRVCQGQGTASYEIVKGKITMIRLNRLDFQNQQIFKIMTPLDVGPSNSPGSQFLGELVCHISRPHQHWLSYVKTDQGWYLESSISFLTSE